MINTIFIIAALLAVFYGIVLSYHASKFSPISSRMPDIVTEPGPIKINYEPDIYKTQDTRMEYPYLPPVNPNAKNLAVLDTLGSPQGLFSNQGVDTKYSVLDTPAALNVNQLVYSGGTTKLIKIPLQYNDPYNERLRSQDILITPYNKIKYGPCE